MGLDLELVSNLTLKYVKGLKKQRESKGSDSILFYEEGNSDRFYDCRFHKNITKCCPQESFGRSRLFPYPKISLVYTPRPV